MNRIIRLFKFFICTTIGWVNVYSQDWNLTTVCNHDFSSTSGQAINIFPLSNDLNLGAQTLTLKNLSYVEHGKADIVGNSIQFIPEGSYQGLAHVLYTACDAKGNCGIGDVSIIISDPSKTTYSDTISEGVLRNNVFRFYLPEPGFQMLSGGTSGKVSRISDLEYQYIPTGNIGAIEQLIFLKDSKREVFHLTIVDQAKKNRFLLDDVIYLNKNTSRFFSVTKNDLSNPVIQSFTQPGIGSLSLNADNTFTYTSTLDFEGIAQFNYTACSNSGCETATVFLYVSDFLPREDLNPLFRVAEGRSVVIPYDIPVQDYEFKILNQPTYGLLDFYKGNNTINLQCESQTNYNPLVYSPFPGFIGKDQFIVNFCLTTGTKQCAPIKITIETYSESGCVPSTEFVWPGDANNDGIVTLKDINSISKLIGTIGSPRANSSSIWSNQPSKDWSRNEGINAKYADANGDGIVDRNDIQVVMGNALQSHQLIPQGVYQVLPVGANASPVARVIAPGDDAIVQLAFGDEQNLLSDIESIHFDLEYNDQLIKPEDIEVSVLENSWFGYDNSILQGRFGSKGKLSYSLSSSRGKGRYGYGNTVRVRTKGGPITGHVEGFKIPKELPLQFNIKNIQLTSTGGSTTSLPDTKATVIIDFNRKSTSPGIFQYPNPTSDYINIYALNSKDLIEQITITDLAGKTVLAKNLVPVDHFKQPVINLNGGIYFLQVKTSSGVFTKKVEIIR
jgi:hypothetical protein